MTNTIKITNLQGQEEEWEEISYDTYLEIEGDYLLMNIDGHEHYYKKLQPKEVYPKVFKGYSRNYEVDDEGNIFQNVSTRTISEYGVDRIALKEALAESEKQGEKQ